MKVYASYALFTASESTCVLCRDSRVEHNILNLLNLLSYCPFPSVGTPSQRRLDSVWTPSGRRLDAVSLIHL